MKTSNKKALKIRALFRKIGATGRWIFVSCGRCINCRDSIREGYAVSSFCLHPRLFWIPF